MASNSKAFCAWGSRNTWVRSGLTSSFASARRARGSRVLPIAVADRSHQVQLPPHRRLKVHRDLLVDGEHHHGAALPRHGDGLIESQRAPRRLVDEVGPDVGQLPVGGETLSP